MHMNWGRFKKKKKKAAALETVALGVRERRLCDKRNKETQDDKLSKTRR